MEYRVFIDGETKLFGHDRKRAEKWLSDKMDEKICSSHRMTAVLETTSTSPWIQYRKLRYCFLPATGFPGDPGSWFVDER